MGTGYPSGKLSELRSNNDMRTALVVSPHLDDAVLSAGQFLAGRPDALVVTVFAGSPKAKTVQTTYDRLSGFANAQEAMASRRAEDAEALALVGAKLHHLNFVDSQYGQSHNRGSIAQAIKWQIEHHDPELILAPLGIGHPDHELVREALLDAALDGSRPLWLYEDMPERVLHPELAAAALEAVRTRGVDTALGFCGDGPLAMKMAALWCYRSQLGLFANRHTLLVPERFWQIKAVAPEETK